MTNWTYFCGRLVACNENGAVLCAPEVGVEWAPLSDLLNANTALSQLFLNMATNKISPHG